MYIYGRRTVIVFSNSILSNRSISQHHTLICHCALLSVAKREAKQVFQVTDLSFSSPNCFNLIMIHGVNF